MPHVGTRGRWLGILGLTTLSAAAGLGYAWTRPSADPVARGLVAYIHGGWEEAAGLARERLKAAGDDPAALRLMARASVQLGRDSSAVSLFHRLGSDAMLAEDNYLLGVALTRSGNNRGGLQVWELARAADPNHTDTLLALTRAYLASDRLAAASETGRLLAVQPGWEGRAKRLLGAIQYQLNDPKGAISLWQRSLELGETEHASASSSNLTRKELSRALLQAKRPVDARDQLRIVLAQAPDSESYWLLSRAYLQEGATSDALAAWRRPVCSATKTRSCPNPRRLSDPRHAANVIIPLTLRSRTRGTHGPFFGSLNSGIWIFHPRRFASLANQRSRTRSEGSGQTGCNRILTRKGRCSMRLSTMLLVRETAG